MELRPRCFNMRGFLSKHSYYLERIMRKMIFLAVAGFFWRKFQSRYASRVVRGRRGY